MDGGEFFAHFEVAESVASPMQLGFDISERQRKPEVHHHGQADAFGRRLKVAKWAAFSHKPTLLNYPALLTQRRSLTRINLAH